MISISRRPLSVASFADMALFAAFCIVSMLMAVSMQLGPYGTGTATALIPALEFAAITTAVGTMFGLFRAGEKKPLGVVVTRTMLALAVAVPITLRAVHCDSFEGGVAQRAVLRRAVHAVVGHPGPSVAAGAGHHQP